MWFGTHGTILPCWTPARAPQGSAGQSRASFPKAGERKVPLGPAPGSFEHKSPDPGQVRWLVWIRVNDPSAGSPTETLLRLLLPLSVKVHETSRCDPRKPRIAAVRIIHRNTQSVGATGGVYKGQGRNQHELMTRTY